MSKDKTLFPQWASVFLAGQTKSLIIPSQAWGTSMGGSEGGKTFWCCRMISGRKKKWLLNYTFFQTSDFSDISSLTLHWNTFRILTPPSVPTSATTTNMQFYLYFLEAWHHLRILFLISYHLTHTYMVTLRAEVENGIPVNVVFCFLEQL